MILSDMLIVHDTFTICWDKTEAGKATQGVLRTHQITYYFSIHQQLSKVLAIQATTPGKCSCPNGILPVISDQMHPENLQAS